MAPPDPEQGGRHRCAISDFIDVLAQLTASTGVVDQAKELVLARGGAWPEPKGHLGLFKIQIDGLYGIGPTPVAAIDD